jgi:hypothetical protein
MTSVNGAFVLPRYRFIHPMHFAPSAARGFELRQFVVARGRGALA